MELPYYFEVSQEKLGRLIRAERQRLFVSPGAFLKHMEDLTGYVMPEQTLFRYERGVTNIPVTALVAFAMTLYGHSWKEFLIDVLVFAFPSSFLDKAERLDSLGIEDHYLARMSINNMRDNPHPFSGEIYDDKDGVVFYVAADDDGNVKLQRVGYRNENGELIPDTDAIDPYPTDDEIDAMVATREEKSEEHHG